MVQFVCFSVSVSLHIHLSILLSVRPGLVHKSIMEVHINFTSGGSVTTDIFTFGKKVSK